MTAPREDIRGWSRLRRGATLTGLGAIALWSLLALFTAATGKVPPFQLAAMTFAVAGAFGIAVAAARGRLAQARPTRAGVALGLYGLFGDTALYFAALKFAPPAEANLVHYLWPLLIVLFAALLPGRRLAPRHLAGAAIGLAGTALLVGGRFGGAGANAPLGFACALLGAFVWASYSVASRRRRGGAARAARRAGARRTARSAAARDNARGSPRPAGRT